MKQCKRAYTFLSQIQTFPLFLLSLSTRKRILIVLFSYVLAVPALWFFFPQLHNVASMILPIICLCWLFRYWGLLINMLSTAVTFWLVYYFLVGNTESQQAFEQRVVIGSGISFLLGFTICLLRTATDNIRAARQQALAAEQKRLLALESEQQITIAYEQQRNINELKDQFLLNVSHELSIPLTKLGSSLKQLENFQEEPDPIKKISWLNQALTSQETLVNLVNGVLNTTMVVSEIPQAKPEAVDVRQLLQEVLLHLAPEDVEAYTIYIQVPEQTTVWADPQLLQQVLQNLLSNVFKYVPRQTEVHIATTQANSSSPICLSIQDAGPGIPAEELPLLFEKFVRLRRDLTGTIRGTGVGLYICKRLMEAMKGRIWVESSGRPGEGSRFCINLPLFSPT